MSPETRPLHALPTTLAVGEALVVVARPEAVLAQGTPPLPEGEAARIARFQRPGDRAARTAAHGLLRSLLSALLGRPPAMIELARDALGRPALPTVAGIDVNLSHGGAWIAVALARGGRIGVDVEDGAAVTDWARLLPIFAHPTERAALGSAPDPAAALRLWALKEAVLKASGEGFSTPPAALRIGIGADPRDLVHAGLPLRARSLALPGGTWLAVATAGLAASPRLVLAGA